MTDAAPDYTRDLTERYDRAAEVYRELWAPMLLSAARPLVAELVGENVGRVVDVGCGVGALLPHLGSSFPGASVVGVDRSSGMLALAPGRFARAVVDAVHLPIRAGCADRLVMLFMLFHLDHPVAGLREARRVLRDQGRIGTLTWAGEIESPAFSVWAECLDAHGAIPTDPAVDIRHEAVDSAAKMDALLRDAGFRETRTWEDEIAATFEVETLIRLRSNLGSSKPRFDSLTPDAAAACLEQARRRMNALTPEDFVAKVRVVYATACV